MSVSHTLDDTLRGAVLCWLATVDGRGQPNVSPKEIWHNDGDRFLIADIASARSVRSIRASPKVCVGILDLFRQRGHKLIGTATVIGPDNAEFDASVRPLREKAGPDFTVRHVIALSIDRIAPILAPSWTAFPERDENEHIRRSHEVYGMRPAHSHRRSAP